MIVFQLHPEGGVGAVSITLHLITSSFAIPYHPPSLGLKFAFFTAICTAATSGGVKPLHSCHKVHRCHHDDDRAVKSHQNPHVVLVVRNPAADTRSDVDRPRKRAEAGSGRCTAFDHPPNAGTNAHRSSSGCSPPPSRLLNTAAVEEAEEHDRGGRHGIT